MIDLGDASEHIEDGMFKDCEQLIEDRGDDPTFCPDCGFYTLQLYDCHSNIDDEQGYHSVCGLVQCTNDSCDYEEVTYLKMVNRDGDEYEIED